VIKIDCYLKVAEKLEVLTILRYRRGVFGTWVLRRIVLYPDIFYFVSGKTVC
jgi:hypothetical protein